MSQDIVLFIVTVAFWSFMCVTIGYFINTTTLGDKIDRVTDYVIKDQDDCWILYKYYEDKEDEIEKLNKNIEEKDICIKNYKKQVFALEIQIKCLQSEICELKNPKIKKDRSD